MTDKKDEQVVETATGLGYVDLVQGAGAQPKTGDTVSVHYTGWLKSGTKFDSSVGPRQPVRVPGGQGPRHQGLGRGRHRHEGGRQAQADHPRAPGLRRPGARAASSRRARR